MRARWVMVVGIAGCYSPSIPRGVPCAQGTGADRCPAGQVCVVRGGVEVCEPPGGSADPDAQVAIDAPIGDDAPVDGPMVDGPADAMVPAGWWNTSWTHRRPIDVTAGSNGAPAGYSIAITLDHASLVGSGRSLASGEDVRIVRDLATTDLDRVLDSGASWNTAATKLWFRSTTALAANTTQRFWVYYGNPGATGAPAAPANVFLLSDGFENGLGAWDFDNGVAVTTTRAHRGTHAVQVGINNGSDKGISAKTFDESDVAFDAWWNLDNTSGIDMSHGGRSKAGNNVYTDLQPPAAGVPPTWDIAQNVSSTYSEVVPPPAGATTPPVDTWFRVTVYMYQDKMAVDVGGTRYVPTSGFSTIGSTSSGTVFLYTWISTQHVWWDDATARRLVLPEPTVALGAVQSL